TNSSEKEPDDEDENENEENSFNSQTFVPSLPTRLNEDRAINEILN
ncbi:18119_t:CDS:1, partial [Rhizophagus irregularis]